MAKSVKPPQKKKVRKRDRDGTEKKLLDAAVRIFASKGYDAATTKSIAEKAGVAEGLIMRYFGNKHGLLLALLKEFAIGEVESCNNLPPKEQNLELEVKNLLRDALNCGTEKKELVSIAIPRAVVDRTVGKELSKFLETMRAPSLARRLKEHSLAGEISETEDIEALSYALALTMMSLSFLGQIILRLDPQLTDRITTVIAKAFAGKLK
jgi:AcrR family transcriptional regulator